MRKKSVTLRAFRLYHSYNPRYFPLRFLQILFEHLSPYFTLWMSAAIVTALASGETSQNISELVIIVLAGNLMIRVVEAVLKRSAETNLNILENNQSNALNAKTLSLDYDKLEDPSVRQHRRKILENSWINGYGVIKLRRDAETEMVCLVNTGLSLLLFTEMLSQVFSTAFQPLMAILLMVMIAALTLTVFFIRRRSQRSAKGLEAVGQVMLEENRFGRGYSAAGLDNRLYRQQDLLDSFFASIGEKHLSAFGRATRVIFTHSIPVIIAQRLSEWCAYMIVCLYCTLGVFPVGSVIKYVGVLSRLSEHLGQWMQLRKERMTNEPYLADYLAYFDIPNDMYQGSLSVEKRSDKKFDIEFRNVSFRYAGASEDAVKNISVHLKVGEKLAVVGMNGSGKTTFIKLLCRLYDPTEGEILMNDFNIRKYDYRQYLDLFSVVFQDYKLLSVPLGNNVASAQHWDTQKAEKLLEKVGFGARYAEMPRGLETPLYKDFDEDGVNVSGGEAQKIALARALYKDAPFIILDEPTAALDPIAEAEIYAKFDEIVGGKTAIYISHRLSSCRFCDRIVVFDQGEIVQIGTHEELLADASGKYYELWNAQAQYYAKE